MTHREAFRTFATQESVAVLWALLCLLLGLRIAAGFGGHPPEASDLLAIVVTVVGHHILEWVAHRFVLHGRRGFLYRYHRAHHARPHDPRFIFMPVLYAVGLLLIVMTSLRPLVGPGTTLTVGLTAVTLGILYEWVHYLTHQPIRPVTWLGRKLKKHHMLHHFKNERYWFGVTARYVDTVLQTNPKQNDVGTHRS